MGRAYLLLVAVAVVACGDSFIASTGGDPSGVGGTATSGPTSTAQGAGTSNGGNANGGNSSGSSTGGGACQGIDVPDLPGGGWLGFALISIDEPGITCPEGGNYYRAQSLPPEVCDCGCAVDADSCTGGVQAFSDLSCQTPIGPATTVPETCEPANSALNAVAFGFTETEAACGTGNDPSPVETSFNVLTCDAPIAAGCNDVPPAPFKGQYCVWQAGIVSDCPVEFPRRYELITNVSDQRGCNDDCACDGQNLDCGGTLTLYSDTCATVAQTHAAPSPCEEPPDTVLAWEYTHNVTGTCTQTSGTTNGNVTATDWETVCCTDS